MVDSHLHGDHAMGNEAYPEVFGASVEVISSVKTREWLEKLGVPRMQETLDGLPKQIAELRTRLEASRDESERAELGTHIEGLEAYLKEMTPARVTLPTMTFDRRLVIHRGGREIHLLFLGRGHTAGDVVAYIPSERVVATGDLMHGLLPYMGDGFPDEWPATLRALEALEFDRVIPGHGSIQEGKSVLAQFRGYVEEITEKVSRGIEQGPDAGRAQEGDHRRHPRLAQGRRRGRPRRARDDDPLPPPGQGSPACSTTASRATSRKSSPISKSARAAASCRSSEARSIPRVRIDVTASDSDPKPSNLAVPPRPCTARDSRIHRQRRAPTLLTSPMWDRTTKCRRPMPGCLITLENIGYRRLAAVHT